MKIITLFLSFFLYNQSAFADAFQNLIAPHLQERASFSLYGQKDIRKKESADKNVPDQRAELGVDSNITIYKNETSRFFLKANAYQLDLGKDFTIGENALTVKRRLSDASFGFGMTTKSDNGSRQSLSATFGSNGDKLFAKERDSSLEAVASYAMTPTEKGQFIFLVHYSNNRSFLNNIPLPVFVYVYRYSKNVLLIGGIPFISATFFEPKNYTVNAFLAPGAHGLEGAKHLSPDYQLLGGFMFKSRAFKYNERIDNKNRIIVQDKKLSFGLKADLTRGVDLALNIGRSFDRTLHEGESLYKVKGQKIHQPNETFLQTKLNLVF